MRLGGRQKNKNKQQQPAPKPTQQTQQVSTVAVTDRVSCLYVDFCRVAIPDSFVNEVHFVRPNGSRKKNNSTSLLQSTFPNWIERDSFQSSLRKIITACFLFAISIVRKIRPIYNNIFGERIPSDSAKHFRLDTCIPSQDS